MFVAGHHPRPHLTQAAKAAAVTAYLANRRLTLALPASQPPMTSRHGRPFLAVDTAVPMPLRRGTPFARPFQHMALGDSFFEPLGNVPQQTLIQRIKWDAKHYRPARFDIIEMTQDGIDGLRVWRVA